MQLGKKWAGNIYGTNTGNFYLTLEGEDDQLKGQAHINDPVYGVAVYDVSGSYEKDKLNLTGQVISSTRSDAMHKDLTINGALNSDGNLRGDWSTCVGTAGTFFAYPHDNISSVSSAEAGNVSLPFKAPPIYFGTLYFDIDEIKHLLSLVKEDFSSHNIIIAITTKEGEHAWHVDDFFVNLSKATSATSLKIFAQEGRNNKVIQSLSIDLGFFGVNQLTVYGADRTVVLGIKTKISSELKKREVFLATIYKKNGLDINFLIFLYMIAILPDITLVNHRLLFEGGIVIILLVLAYIHKKVTPLLKIYDKKPGHLRHVWIKLSSIIMAAINASVGGAAVWIGHYLLTKFFT